GRIRARHTVLVLSAALAIAYGASVLVSLHHAYQRVLGDSGATLENIARSAEVETARSLFEIDATLIGVDRVLSTMFSGTQWDDPSVTTLLRQFDEQKLAISGIFILDDRSREINRSPPPHGRARDQAQNALLAMHQRAAHPTLIIGSPDQDAEDGS